MKREKVYQILLAPHISEKSALLAEKADQYVFKVAPSATKPEIKEAVEALFDVKVKSVNVINIKGKQKFFRGRPGRRSGIRKAVIRLMPGQEIDVIGGE